MAKGQEIKKKLDKHYSGETALRYNFARLNDIRQKDVLDREGKIIESFLSGVDSRGKILDVACGTGIMFKHYGARKIYGVDISEDMLKIAKKSYPSAKLVKSEAEKLPFPNNTFSVVISSKFLCHTPNYKKIVTEMVRVTKPGGFLILDFFNKHSFSYPTTKLRLMTGKLRHFNLLSYSDVKKLAKKNSLEIKEIRSKVFLPIKLFPKSAHKTSYKLNSLLANRLPKVSTPMYFLFRKKK